MWVAEGSKLQASRVKVGSKERCPCGCVAVILTGSDRGKPGTGQGRALEGRPPYLGCRVGFMRGRGKTTQGRELEVSQAGVGEELAPTRTPPPPGQGDSAVDCPAPRSLPTTSWGPWALKLLQLPAHVPTGPWWAGVLHWPDAVCPSQVMAGG